MNISAHESEISSLQQELQLQTDQIIAILNLLVQEKDSMTACVEFREMKSLSTAD